MRNFQWTVSIFGCGVASSLMVLLSIEAPGLTAKIEGVAGPERGVATIGVEVPASTARLPDGALHSLLEFSVECLLAIRTNFESLQVAAFHLAQGVQDIGHLRLDHIDHRVVPQAGIWAKQQEEIGEAGDACAKVSVRAALP